MGLAIIVAVLSLSGAAGQEAGPKVPRAGILKDLPSAPGPHLEKIKALNDGEWLPLGSPAPDPAWGKGRGRSWSPRMAYAPDLGGAFLCGTGVHGYVKPDGRYMDDVFFYDLNAHRWIAVYPGTDVKNMAAMIRNGDVKVRDDGQLTDGDGRPVPFCFIPHHSYYTHTYVSDLGLYATYQRNSGIGGDQYTFNPNAQDWNGKQKALYKESYELLQDQMKGKSDRVKDAPFVFNSRTGNFERHPCDGYAPKAGFSMILHYVPSKKMLWSYYPPDVSLYDFATHRWSKVKTQGTPPSGGDFGACYDTKRDRIYVFRGLYSKWDADAGNLYSYDLKADSWSVLKDKGAAPPAYHCNPATVHYDAVGDAVIVAVHGGQPGGPGVGVYALDLTTQTWDAGPAAIPREALKKCWSSFYAPELNAHFFFAAHDSGDDGSLWVWRYKKAKGK